MQHFVKFKYVIFAYLAHYFWLSCHVRTIFHRSEILKEKPQQSEQREANKQTKKCIKLSIGNKFYLRFTIFSHYNHHNFFLKKSIYEGVPFCKFCRHTACNWWLSNEYDRRVGLKLLFYSYKYLKLSEAATKGVL